MKEKLIRNLSLVFELGAKRKHRETNGINLEAKLKGARG